MSVLRQDQQGHYLTQGYVLVSGLISEEVAAAAEETMWRLVGATRDDPASWANLSERHQSYDDSALTACYTPAVLGAAAALSGDDPATIQAPDRAYAINVYPSSGEWQWPRPHIDHAIREHGYRVFPRAFRIAAMTFLNDVPWHGGGTIVWPGSHRKLEELARSDPERYELMWTLGQAIGQVDIGEPVELTPRRGDVLYYHYLCAHSGSKNTSDRPRFALNMKW